jgi:C-terminal processing protease CtpA/Prc
MANGKSQPLVPLSKLVSSADWKNSLSEEVKEKRVFYNIIYPYAAISVIKGSNYDFSKVAQILIAMRSGQSFNKAFNNIYGMEVTQFENYMTSTLNKEIIEFVNKFYGSQVIIKRKTGALGFGWFAKPDGIHVFKVNSNSEAEKVDLKEKDVIVSVDEVNTKGISAQKFIESIDGEPGTQIALEVLKDGKQIQILLTRQPPGTEHIYILKS